MKKFCVVLAAVLLIIALVTACSQADSSISGGISSRLPVSDEMMSSSTVASQANADNSTTGISVPAEKIVASIQLEHDALSRIDIINDGDAYGVLRLYFEPMEWDDLENKMRAEIVEKAIRYAYKEAVVYGDAVSADFEGYTSDGKLIFTNLPSGYVVITNTDGSNSYTSNSNVYFEVLMSIPSEHERLSRVDLTSSDAGYWLHLYFEPMEWDTLDDGARVEIAKGALTYAFELMRPYGYPLVGFGGIASDGKVIISMASSGDAVLRDTDGNLINPGTPVWP